MYSCPIQRVGQLSLSNETTLYVAKIDDKLVAVTESTACIDGHPTVSTSIAQLFSYSDLIIGEIKKNLNAET